MHFAAWHDPLLPLSVEVMGQSTTIPGQETELSITVGNLTDESIFGTRLILNAPEGAVCVSGSEDAVTVPQRIRWELGVLQPRRLVNPGTAAFLDSIRFGIVGRRRLTVASSSALSLGKGRLGSVSTPGTPWGI
jgi:hypothetical protein